MTLRPLAALLLPLLTLAACDGSPPPPAQKTDVAAPTAARRPPPSRRAAQRPRLGAPLREDRLDVKQVRGLLRAWRDAQNAGKFDRYAKLYAQKLTGVRRTGLRSYHFNRKGWLADRRRMFQKKMTVGYADVVISAHARTAVVRFTQTWSSDGFKDTGPKQLVVVREGQRLTIAREEMLASTVLARTTNTGPGTGELLLVAPQRWKDVFHVVLHERPSPAWAKPGFRMLSRTGVVVRDVDESKLPAKLRAWKGRQLQVYDARGQACAATITGLALRAEVIPHFGTVNDWNGADGNPRKPDATVARAIWGLATGHSIQTQKGPGLWLVARVDKTRQQCRSGVLWARDARLPKPTFWTLSAAQTHRQGAVAAFRKLPGWRTIQQGFLADGKKGSWDLYASEKPTVDVFVGPKPHAPVLSVTANAGNGCGDFEGTFWGLWRVAGPKRTLLTHPTHPDPNIRPVTVFDSDGDGHPEILSTPTHGAPLRVITPVKVGTTLRWRVTRAYRIPFFDCGC